MFTITPLPWLNASRYQHMVVNTKYEQTMRSTLPNTALLRHGMVNRATQVAGAYTRPLSSTT